MRESVAVKVRQGSGGYKVDLLHLVLTFASLQWNNNQIGWHESDVHHSLSKHGDTIIPNFSVKEDETCSEQVRVFVPLCGKTVDLAFLARHPSVSDVVGVDGIQQALLEFTKEQPDLRITKQTGGSDAYGRFTGKGLTLLKGDFFDLQQGDTGGRFDAVWDRASFIAINPSLREEYVKVMGRLIKPGGVLLVSTIEYTGTEEAMQMGPPFSVPESEVRKWYENEAWVESVELVEKLDEFQRAPETKELWEAAGVTSVFELVLVIKAKAA